MIRVVRASECVVSGGVTAGTVFVVLMRKGKNFVFFLCYDLHDVAKYYLYK